MNNLNPEYTFKNFIRDASNDLAVSLAKTAAKRSNVRCSLLYICGASGLGKTHLLHAIGHEVLRKNPKLNVLYICMESFINQLLAAIKKGKAAEFRKMFRKYDLLLVDDIHFLSGKERTQEEVDCIFSSFQSYGRQLVVAGDIFRKDFTLLGTSLKAHLSAGMIGKIQPLTTTGKIAFLKAKAKMIDVNLSDTIIKRLATLPVKSSRELEGALLRLAAQASLSNSKIDLSYVRNFELMKS